MEKRDEMLLKTKSIDDIVSEMKSREESLFKERGKTIDDIVNEHANRPANRRAKYRSKANSGSGYNGLLNLGIGPL